MGAVTAEAAARRRERQGAALAALAGIAAGVVVGVVGGGALWWACGLGGAAVVVAGTVWGVAPVVIVGAVVQLAAGCGALVAGAPVDGVRPVAVVVGAAVWVAFELACTSLESRPAPTSTPELRSARFGDAVAVLVAGAVLGGLALVVAGRGPVGGVLLRLAAMAVVVLVVAALWALSRPPRIGQGGRRGRPGS